MSLSQAVKDMILGLMGGEPERQAEVVDGLNSGSSAIQPDGSIPFSANQSMGNYKLTNLADPTSAQDAATRAYVLANAGSGGANTALSNLASTSLNTFLTFDTGVPGAIRTRVGLPDSQSMSVRSGNANSGISGDSTLSTGLGSTLTGSTLILTGNASGGDSGGITLQPGTATGTRGKIKIVDGSEGTAGDIWTSTDTLGNGSWVTPTGGSAPTSRITLDTFNGFGSTNTAQMIFTNITDNSGGADLTYATAATGDTITVNTTGMYSIVMNTSSAGADDCGYGILINASAAEMQTFPFLAIPTHRLAYGYIPVSAATILSCSGTQYLTAGDVVTFCQFSNTVANPVASSYVQVTITRVN